MITYIIIAITVITSIKGMDDYSMKNKLMFNAYAIKHHKEWYRFFSGGLIHADWTHLFFNMFSLFMIGKHVESYYSDFYVFGSKGPLFYILLYVGGLFMSSVYSFEKHKNNSYYNALGASGAVSSVIFAFIILNPTAKIGLFILPPIIPAYIFGGIYLAAEYYLGKRGNTNIGHDAHFWGAVYGMLFTIALKPSLFNLFIQQIIG